MSLSLSRYERKLKNLCLREWHYWQMQGQKLIDQNILTEDEETDISTLMCKSDFDKIDIDMLRLFVQRHV